MRFMRVQQAVELIQSEYEQTPGLRVTFWQAQHLWNLSTELCDRALSALVRTRFLVPASDGTYVRRGES
jgi:hypothetical protein